MVLLSRALPCTAAPRFPVTLFPTGPPLGARQPRPRARPARCTAPRAARQPGLRHLQPQRDAAQAEGPEPGRGVGSQAGGQLGRGPTFLCCRRWVRTCRCLMFSTRRRAEVGALGARPIGCSARARLCGDFPSCCSQPSIFLSLLLFISFFSPFLLAKHQHSARIETSACREGEGGCCPPRALPAAAGTAAMRPHRPGVRSRRGLRGALSGGSQHNRIRADKAP